MLLFLCAIMVEDYHPHQLAGLNKHYDKSPECMMSILGWYISWSCSGVWLLTTEESDGEGNTFWYTFSVWLTRIIHMPTTINITYDHFICNVVLLQQRRWPNADLVSLLKKKGFISP